MVRGGLLALQCRETGANVEAAGAVDADGMDSLSLARVTLATAISGIYLGNMTCRVNGTSGSIDKQVGFTVRSMLYDRDGWIPKPHLEFVLLLESPAHSHTC